MTHLFKVELERSDMFIRSIDAVKSQLAALEAKLVDDEVKVEEAKRGSG